ncbi:MAG TPA: response regulator [Microvirga sp.]|jgi:CheY-like chemotaxis protein
MTLWGMTINAGAWLAPVTAVAAMASLAALVLLRDHLRLERHTLALEREVARLKEAARLMSEASHAAQGLVGAAPDAPPVPRRAPTLVDTRVEPMPIQETPRPTQSGPTRILLAEDDDVNALFAVQALKRTGALVDWVPDGEAAYEAILASFAGKGPTYHAVLMDLRMPRLDGIEATRQIRRLEAALQRPEPLRIIAVTATTMRRDRQEAERAGIDVFLAKPYAPEALAGLLAPEAAPLAQAS